MRKVVFVLAFALPLLFTRCVLYSEYYVTSYSTDLSFFNEKGFFISENNSFNFDYSTVGFVTSISYSGVSRKGEVNETMPERIKRIEQEKQEPHKSRQGSWNETMPERIERIRRIEQEKDGKHEPGWKKADIYDALGEIYKHSVEMGANGIINLKINYHYDNNNGIIKIEVSGTAIKKL
jgi:hypothetical protein